MDDVMRDNNVDQKLTEIDNLHPSLQFTIERETNSSIPFLDMRIKRINGTLESTKPIDTGLTMNYHVLAPWRYKGSVVAGLVHRIWRWCSTWSNFHDQFQ